MNIVFIAPECFPFAKNSSISDLISKLSKEIEHEGHNVKIIMPRYGSIDPQTFQIERLPADFKISFDGNTFVSSVYKGIIAGSLVSVFFLESQNYFSNSKEIYLSNSKSNTDRFNFFGDVAFKIISELRLNPEIIHVFGSDLANFVRVYHEKSTSYQSPNKAGIVFTLNNLPNTSEVAYPSTILAIKNSDYITTVSKAYANELLLKIQNKEISEALALKKERFQGILAGLDKDEYNPETDKLIAQTYSKNYFSIGKKKCKEDLLSNLGLEYNLQIPLFGIIARFKEDKGIDLLISSIPHIASLNLQVIILGKGESHYEQELSKLSSRYKNIKVCVNYDHSLSKKIYAGADFFISTAKYAHSGSAVLIAMRYGAIPIAYPSGALKEILIGFEAGEEANSILYNTYKKEGLVEAILQALKHYKNKERWPGLVKQVMNFEIHGLSPAKQYINIYEKVTPLLENLYQ